MSYQCFGCAAKDALDATDTPTRPLLAEARRARERETALEAELVAGALLDKKDEQIDAREDGR